MDDKYHVFFDYGEIDTEKSVVTIYGWDTEYIHWVYLSGSVAGDNRLIFNLAAPEEEAEEE